MCGSEVGTQVGQALPLEPPRAFKPIHTPPPPAPPPGTTSLTIGALGASKTLLVHRQLFVVPQELVVGSCVKMVQLVQALARPGKRYWW